MLHQEIIRKKRDGKIITSRELQDFVAGITSGEVSEGQISAFAMAVFFNNMSREEAVALTLAMRDSGDVLDWSHLDGPVLDKHSTGGVGDNVSLLLGPMIAACGGYVPMISGRGLGHTGGTLDKFDAIPGYQTQPDNALFRETVEQIGCAIIGQTQNLAPADKRFYSIRDVTSTVESVPLITASILSKKLAAGLQGLVLDVKLGSGAFMQEYDEAKELARSLVSVANGAGLQTSALVTDMDHSLASAAGNAVEVKNAVQNLTGEIRDDTLMRVTIALCAQMLLSGGLAKTKEEAETKLNSVLASGRAAEKFGQMVTQLGGPSDFVENMDHYLPVAPIKQEIFAGPEHAEYAGKLAMDTRQIGLAVIELGGGRTRPQDDIDHSVGITNIARRDWNGADPICTLYAQNEETLEKSRRRILDSLRPASDEQLAMPAIFEEIKA